MATTDLRGVLISSTDPTVASNPNPDLAIKAPVIVATTGPNITLSGLQTIDGYLTLAGDRVLVKDQATPSQNGIYNAATGNWTRAYDALSNTQWAAGTLVLVTGGSVNVNTLWEQTTAGPIVLGTTSLAFLACEWSGAPRVVTTPGALPIRTTDSLVLLEAAVTSITLPAGKTTPVTIIDVLGNFQASNCTVTAVGTINGQNSDVLTVNYTARTYLPVPNNANYLLAPFVGSPPANTVLAGPPTGIGNIPAFRKLVAADMPANAYSVPFVNAASYGVGGSIQTTNGAITSGTRALTLASAIDFANAQGIRINHAGAAFTLGSPSGLTVTPKGAGGTTIWNYQIASLDGAGGIGAAITAVSTGGGNSTLSTSNYNAISWTAPGGTAPLAYALYRSKGSGTALVLVAIVFGTTYNDYGGNLTGPEGGYGIPDWTPTSPLTASLNDWLLTSIASGAGTTSVTLSGGGAAAGATIAARANSTTYSAGQLITVPDSALSFVCTTAGTTAGSEPGGYATATNNGSSTDTVTDGTAKFCSMGPLVNHDDTVGLQTWLTAVAAIGGTGYLPAGLYPTSSALTSSQRCKLIGDGWSSDAFASAGQAGVGLGVTTYIGGSVIMPDPLHHGLVLGSNGAFSLSDFAVFHRVTPPVGSKLTSIIINPGAAGTPPATQPWNNCSLVDHVWCYGADWGLQLNNAGSFNVRACTFEMHMSDGIVVTAPNLPYAGDWLIGPGNTFVSGSVTPCNHIAMTSGGGPRIMGNKLNTAGSINAGAGTAVGIAFSPTLNVAQNSMEPVLITGNSIEGLAVGISMFGGTFGQNATLSQCNISSNQIWSVLPISVSAAQAPARANATAYVLGAFITVPDNTGGSGGASYPFVCTTAGTTAGSEPAGYATATAGSTVTDGTAVFSVPSTRINAHAYSTGQWIFATSNALPFQCTGAGTSAGAQPAAYATAIINTSVTDGTATFQAANIGAWCAGMLITGNVIVAQTGTSTNNISLDGVSNCQIVGNSFGLFQVGGVGTTVVLATGAHVASIMQSDSAFVGVPIPTTSTPAMPASTATVANTFPYEVEVTVYGSFTQVSVTPNGGTIQTALYNAGGLLGATVHLNPLDTIGITYSGAAPTWLWRAMHP
jgi:hypothetical protein